MCQSELGAAGLVATAETSLVCSAARSGLLPTVQVYWQNGELALHPAPLLYMQFTLASLGEA